eukprot:11298155-Alexandrium_andersonii.AAC.1
MQPILVEPRMVAAEIQEPSRRVTAVLARAPCRSQANDDQATRQWWDAASTRLRAWKSSPRPDVAARL